MTLTSPSEYTPWPVLQNVRQNVGNDTRTNASRRFPSYRRSFDALPHRHHPISGPFHFPIWGAFQLSVTLLLHYRSQDVFSFGSWWLPNSHEISNPRYSRHESRRIDYAYGAITLYGIAFQEISASQFPLIDSAYNTTSPLTRIQFELCRVRSPLLTASLRFLFLPLLRCFNPGRSRSRKGINPKVRSSH